MIPYIFFDIDGVLNNESDWRIKRFYINDECLFVFKDFVNLVYKRYKVRPKLITCSTWRAGFDNKGVFCDNSLSIVEAKFKQLGLTIDGSTPVSNKTRQEEIEYYIRRHNVNKYIVIDDDESLYNRRDDINLYVSNYKTGLTIKDIKRLIKQFVKCEV